MERKKEVQGKLRFLIAVLGILWLGASQAKGGTVRAPGASDIPWPINVGNQKVELADGEVYRLAGKIVFAPGVVSLDAIPYLEVDFEEHPWLESAKRKAWPFYPIENPVVDWKKWDGHRVVVLVRVSGQVLQSSQSDPVYTLILKAQREPSTRRSQH